MVTEEIAKLTGKSGEPIVMEVEKGAIKRYAEAIGDLNPLYHDEEYASHSRYGTIIAPPGFFGWPVKATLARPGLMFELFETMRNAGYPDILDGGIEFDFRLPVRAGDMLVSFPKIVDVRLREGKGGREMVFSIIETSYTNQNGEVVAAARSTLICREPQS